MRLKLTQGSAEWLDLRKKSITSTDSSIIMNLNPYKDRDKLLYQKLELEPPDELNEAMMIGNRLEPVAREKYIEVTGDLMFPAVFIRDDLPWAMASLDGINFDEDKIIEIKCGSRAFERGLDIPEYYQCQMQHAMWVSGATRCDYFCYWNGEYKLIPFNRDDAFIEKMIEAEKSFLLEMENADLEALGIEIRDDEAFHEVVTKWKVADKFLKEARSLLKRAETVEKECKSDISCLIVGRGAIGFGVKIKRASRIGNIDYSSIPELVGLDLEKHRKPRTYWWEASLLLDASKEAKEEVESKGFL